jgi:membrane protein
VPLRSALLGAAVTGSILQTSQWVFIKNQIGTANYNIIYGSFAQIPLFLIWIYLSWLIVLIGAQVSFMVRSWRPRHGVRTWAAPDCLTVVAGSLAVLAHLVQATREEKSPVSVMELSRLLDVPIDFVQHRMFELERAGLVVEVGKGARTGFVPNFLPSEKQLTQVAMLLAGGQKDSLKSGLGDVLTFFRELFGPAWTDFEHSEANMTMDVFSTNFCSRSEKLK